MIIIPFDRMIGRWSVTHILKEVLKRLHPSITNFNTPPSIIHIVRIIRIGASLYYVAPGVMLLFMTHSVNNGRMGSIGQQTTTRFSIPRFDVIERYSKLLSTLAKAFSVRSLLTCWVDLSAKCAKYFEVLYIVHVLKFSDNKIAKSRRFLTGLCGFFLAIFILSGCNRRLTPTSVSETTDSTVTTITPKQILVRVPGEIVYQFSGPLPCDPIKLIPKPVTIQARKKSAFIKAVITPAGSIELSGGCDSLEQVVSVLDKEVFRLRNQNKTTIIKEYKTRGIDKFCRWFTGISLLLFVIAIVLYIKKKLPFF